MSYKSYNIVIWCHMWHQSHHMTSRILEFLLLTSRVCVFSSDAGIADLEPPYTQISDISCRLTKQRIQVQGYPKLFHTWYHLWNYNLRCIKSCRVKSYMMISRLIICDIRFFGAAKLWEVYNGYTHLQHVWRLWPLWDWSLYYINIQEVKMLSGVVIKWLAWLSFCVQTRSEVLAQAKGIKFFFLVQFNI